MIRWGEEAIIEKVWSLFLDETNRLCFKSMLKFDILS